MYSSVGVTRRARARGLKGSTIPQMKTPRRGAVLATNVLATVRGMSGDFSGNLPAEAP